MSLTEAHDPTASATTFPEHPALLTRLSRNEVETLCLKAARGAGMQWGLAEEAARIEALFRDQGGKTA